MFIWKGMEGESIPDAPSPTPLCAGRKLGCQWLSHSQSLVRWLFSCYLLKVAFFFSKQYTMSWTSEAGYIWTRHYKDWSQNWFCLLENRRYLSCRGYVRRTDMTYKVGWWIKSDLGKSRKASLKDEGTERWGHWKAKPEEGLVETQPSDLGLPASITVW